jgi:hypothetical protein
MECGTQLTLVAVPAGYGRSVFENENILAVAATPDLFYSLDVYNP